MTSIVANMQESLRVLVRVDKLIFPLLSLNNPYLNVPDIRQDPRLRAIYSAIQKTLEEGLKKSIYKLKDLTKYSYIFDKKIDSILLDLKKRTFILMNEVDL